MQDKKGYQEVLQKNLWKEEKLQTKTKTRQATRWQGNETKTKSPKMPKEM